MILRDWIEEYMELREPEVHERTLGLDRWTLGLLNGLAELEIDEITGLDAKRWRAELMRSGVSETTVAGHCRRVRQCVKMAVEADVCDSNPFASLKTTAPEPDYGPVALTARHVMDTIHCAPVDKGWRNLVALCSLAGMRKIEALRVTWDIVAEDRLRVPKIKTERREIRLEPALLSILGPLGEPDALIAPVPEGDLWRRVQGFFEKAGVGRVDRPLRTLRRWRAETWVKAYPEAVVDSWMGHSMAIARKHYRRVPAEYFGNAAPSQIPPVQTVKSPHPTTDKAESADKCGSLTTHADDTPTPTTRRARPESSHRRAN